MVGLLITLLLAGDAGAVLALLVILFVYFLPAIIGRGKRDSTAIFWLNLLSGWTGVGWIGAFIWALTKDSRPAVAVHPPTPPAPVATRTSTPLQAVPMAARTSASLPVASKSIPEPEPNVAAVAAAMAPPVKPAALSVSGELERLFYLKEKGALTDEEYIVQKAKLLA